MCPARLANVALALVALSSAVAAQGGAKPLVPGECRVSFSTDRRGEADVATVSLTYRFQTHVPLAVVSLGARGTFPVSAKFSSGTTPALVTGDDGFSVRVPVAGTHELTLVTECAVTPRAGGAEVGFDLGLPGSVVTTLATSGPTTRAFAVALKGPAGEDETRRFGPGRLTTTSDRPGGAPLGPVISLAVSWDDPTVRPFAATTATFETDVRVEDTVVESETRLRLSGNERTWSFDLPAGAQLEVTRAAARVDGRVERGVTVTKPTTAARHWVATVPEPGEWLATVRHRLIRPAVGSPEWLGPYAVGPATVVGAGRQTGTVRVFAPPAVRIVVSHGSELRPADPTPAGGEPPAAAFFVRTVPATAGPAPSPPLLTFEIRPAPAAVAVRPSHRLRLTDTGWQWRAAMRVIPTHVELSQVVLDVPPGWGGIEAGPADVVDGVQTVPGEGTTRRMTVRLSAARKEPFDLTFVSNYPAPGGPNAATLVIVFPRVVGATERDASVAVGVPDGWTVKGTVADGDGGTGPTRKVDLVPDAPGKSGSAVPSAAANCDRAALAADLTWHPYRPDLTATTTADAVFGERQLVVTQTIAFDGPTPYPRPLHVRGPATAAGIRATPPLTPVGPGEFAFAPPTDKARFAVTVTYAVPYLANADTRDRPVGLFWAEDATNASATVRVWAPPGRRATGARGPWREADLTPSPDRDSWPALCLTATRRGGDPVPLFSVLIADGPNTTYDTVIERAEMTADTAPDAAHALVTRYWLSRWPTGGIVFLTSDSFAPLVLVDGKRADVRPVEAGNDGFLVPLPEARPGRTPLTVEIRLGRSSRPGDFRAPLWPRATFRTEPRWVVTAPSGSVLLDLRPSLTAEGGWVWRGVLNGFAFVPRDEPDAARPESSENNLAGTAIGAGTSVRVVTVPKSLWIIGCSSVVLAAGVYGLRRPGRAGRVVVTAAAVVAVASFVRPQLTAQALSGSQPGLVVVLLTAIGRAARRSWLERRGRALAAFVDRDPNPAATPLPTGRSRATPAPIHSAGA